MSATRRGGITLRPGVQLGPGPITLEDIRRFFAGIVARLDLESVGDAEIVSMSFAKLLSGILSGDQVLKMSGAGVILQSANYIRDLQRFRTGIVNVLSKELHVPGAHFTEADEGIHVYGDLLVDPTTIDEFIDEDHVMLDVFPGGSGLSTNVYMPERAAGTGWALYGDGTMDMNVGAIFRGQIQIKGFEATTDGTIKIGQGDFKLTATAEGAFIWGSGGQVIGITPSGQLYAGGVDFATSIFRVDNNGDFRLRNSATSSHSIPVSAIDFSAVLAPVMSPNGGNFDTAVNVAIVSLSQNALIYYTTDGTTPDKTKTLYTGPVALVATTTLKAIAIVGGLFSSTVTSKTFTEDGGNGISTPQFSPVPGGPYTPVGGTLTVELSCLTPGASIRYTIDGTTPTISHGTLISPPDGVTPPSGETELPLGTTTLKAIAYVGATTSGVESGTYEVTSGGSEGGGGRGDLP